MKTLATQVTQIVQPYTLHPVKDDSTFEKLHLTDVERDSIALDIENTLGIHVCDKTARGWQSVGGCGALCSGADDWGGGMPPHSIARWPAMMGRKTAMEYLDVGETAFEGEIAAGRIPEGIMFGGKPHWRRDALDKALAIISGELVTDHIARFEERRRGKAA